jgi:hypothetical protein
VAPVLTGAATGLASMAVGANDWKQAAVIRTVVALVVRGGLPWVETAWWWWKRENVLLMEENDRLRRQYEEATARQQVGAPEQPELTLVFDPQLPQCIHDKAGVKNQTLRIFRVGISHAGYASVVVRVRLVDMSPYEQGASYRSHELLPSGQDFDTFTATVNPTVTPLVFFEVVGQLFPAGGPANSLHIRYAAKGLKYRHLNGSGPFRLVVGIDALKAEPPIAFVLTKNQHGIWEMRKAADDKAVA